MERGYQKASDSLPESGKGLMFIREGESSESAVNLRRTYFDREVEGLK